jgi:hypothetical protein
MNKLRCPHCHARKMMRPRIHQDVVAVMPCPACHELAVMFRDVVIPLDRKVIETGTNEERAQHFARVIAAFLEAGIMPFQSGDGMSLPDLGEIVGDEDHGEITEGELEKFVKVDLKALDDPSYFRKHFGR